MSMLLMILVSKKSSINNAILANVSRMVQCQHPSIVFLTNTDIISDFSNDLNPATSFSKKNSILFMR